MKTYEINGQVFDCHFYNNGVGDEGVVVFNPEGELLFKFHEKINGKEIVYLLKGYSLLVDTLT